MNDYKTIEKEIQNLNEVLKNKYNSIFNLDRDKFKEDIISKIGKIGKLEKLSEEELKSLGLIVGVDGSVNRVGGAFPHYVELFQALAKPTLGENLYLNEIYCPLLSDDFKDENKEKSNREKMLAQIEIDVAIKSIEEQKPKILMMDGGLIRYRINDYDRYNELIELCESTDTIILGVIKDLKTNIISSAISEDESFYDREILYGKLNQKDLVEIYDSYNKKFENGGLVSAFLRPSSSPMVVGVDLIESQRHYLKDMCKLVYSLTPINSRGVPLWLDIVDKEVKITDTLIKSMLEEYLDRDIYERFFISERDRRSL